MSERDPFQNLRDLIDEPVAPRDAFADELRSRLMREISASTASREEQAANMDAVFMPRPSVAFPTESTRRNRSMVILELAAAAIIILGLMAALNRGWFQNDPDPATVVPSALLQDDSSGTPATQPEETSTPITAVVPSIAPLGTVWAVPLPAGESLDFGGMLVEDDTVYRLLATPSFVGVQAVDADSGLVKWQRAHAWAGYLFAADDGVLFFDGGGETLTAIDAETGDELWRANVAGSPIALDTEDDRVYVLLDTDFVTALDEQTGDQLWVAQGRVPENPTGGSVSLPADGKIAVENNVIAAISNYGVLSGFDAATGGELWAHEGYDAAMTTIQSENDLFVVSTGSFESGTLTAAQNEYAGTPTSGSPVVGAVAVAGESSSGELVGTIANVSCAGYFAPSSPEEGTPPASQVSVSAGGVSDGVAGSTVLAGIQGIDPATGSILWEQQQASLAADSDVTGAVSLCVVNTVTGELQTLPGPTNAGQIDDRVAIIGIATGQGVVPVESDDEAVSVSVLAQIGTVSDGSSAFIALVSSDAGVFGTMADGTLVKIEGQPAFDNSTHEDVQDDSDDSSSESDD